MRNPFSKQGKPTSDDDCCVPLTFEQEPAGDQHSSADGCAPLVFEDQLEADTAQAREGGELPARDDEAASA